MKPIEEILKPTSYHILVEVVKAPREIRGIAIPEERASKEDQASPMVKVLALGPDCFMDLQSNPPRRRGTPRCAVGDTVLVRPYSGSTKVNVRNTDKEYRMIVDDAVEGIVLDPDLIRRGE